MVSPLNAVHSVRVGLVFQDAVGPLFTNHEIHPETELMHYRGPNGLTLNMANSVTLSTMLKYHFHIYRNILGLSKSS
jgi:hypothetical protein